MSYGYPFWFGYNGKHAVRETGEWILGSDLRVGLLCHKGVAVLLLAALMMLIETRGLW